MLIFSLFSGVLCVLHMGSNDIYDRGKIHLYLNFFDMWGCFGWNCGDMMQNTQWLQYKMCFLVCFCVAVETYLWLSSNSSGRMVISLIYVPSPIDEVLVSPQRFFFKTWWPRTPPGDGWENSTGSLQLRGISEAIALDPAQLQTAELGLWHSDVTRLTDSETMSLDELVDQGRVWTVKHILW